VLDELFGAGMRAVPSETATRSDPDDPRLARVLEAAERMSSVGAVAAALSLDSAETRAALGRLEAEGWLVRRDLGGWERTLGGPEPVLGDGEPRVGEDGDGEPGVGEGGDGEPELVGDGDGDDVLEEDEPMPDD
jgi:hypothetical protein